MSRPRKLRSDPDDVTEDDVDRIAISVPTATKALAQVIRSAENARSFSPIFHRATLREVQANEHLRLLFGDNPMDSPEFKLLIDAELRVLDGREDETPSPPLTEIRVQVPRRTRAIVNAATKALHVPQSAFFHQALLRDRYENKMLAIVFNGDLAQLDQNPAFQEALAEAIEAIQAAVQSAAASMPRRRSPPARGKVE